MCGRCGGLIGVDLFRYILTRLPVLTTGFATMCFFSWWISTFPTDTVGQWTVALVGISITAALEIHFTAIRMWHLPLVPR